MRMEHTKWNGLFEGVIKAYLRFIWEREEKNPILSIDKS